MNILPGEIIRKKRFGGELNEKEIREFVQGVVTGEFADYQTAALLMAICINGMTDRETLALTLAMTKSGDTLNMDDVPGVKIDKHSTGGVGDTTSMVLVPLVAACGVKVAKMSGRGLGFTGGTLDKLESVPGLRVSIPIDEFKRIVRDVGCAVVGQSAELAPADKVLYALRDVTETVDCLPLIVSSILSKKLAAGCDVVVLDVKTGSGALMHTLNESLELAKRMVQVGKMAGKPVAALVTGMDQPLGTHVGNALEVKEAIDILSGRAGGDLLEVSLALGGHMLVLAGKAETTEDGARQMREAIASGAGLDKLRQMIAAQGGNPAVCDDVSLLPRAAVIRQAVCGRAGWVQKMDTTALGLASQAMGAGRKTKEDQLDYSVGYILQVRIGDQVEADTPLCELHARTEEDAERAEEAVRAAVFFGEEPCERAKDFLALVTADGVKRR
jgi:pyrimidine-nucleoside phosphorylase